MDPLRGEVGVGIVDWELPFHTEPTPLERVFGPVSAVSVYPPGAAVLLARLSPYLASVTEALASLLQARGLSLASVTLAELLAIEGLSEEVLEAASAAVAHVDGVGLRPFASQRDEVRSDDLPAGWSTAPSLHDSAFRVLKPEEARSAWPLAADPEGWGLHIARGPVHLMYDEDGEPCYPDTPAFEEYWPKCPVPEPPLEADPVPCREDPRFLRADGRLREHRSFERLPSSFRGYDYREKLEQSVVLPVEELYRCGENPSSVHTMASWFGPPGPGVIRLYERFLDLETEWDLLGVVTGPVDFRAAILLHEHVHRIEDPQMGAVSAPPERSYYPAGSVGQDDCPGSGTEYDAAYLQALYLGAGDGIARVVADIYGRRQCGQIGRSAQMLAAAGDLVEALALGWVASLEVIVTLTAWLGGQAAPALLADLLPPQVAAMLLLALA
jgi:hypothetical protein